MSKPSISVEITRAWEFANNGCGALAEAVHTLRDGADHTARGNALMLLEEARKSLNAAVSLVEFQISDVAKSLRTHP